MTDRCIILVSNLPPQTTEQTIKDAFVIFGDLADIKMKMDRNQALIEFNYESDAEAAIDNMDGAEIYGQTIYCTFATKGNLVDKTKPVWDGNLN
ncbi:hypothetical protein TVAG_401640 [Trichomonas vaginalis G3]|uniref:RRM domain-containing protein n=1 Tax=Trichomonas vaginalis (strain ATCC PRA-98 / G3) TaxID=412133 RepID=A2EGD1_TRIV3|nr:peptidyl-prolyl cis-trans isomerase protein [Trichomonas vaginalis G3]EAX72899.1 hypothetical protein TVAG_477650 [Trichomonas vaginalis G3]EAY08310.1 hypothetical protein TVAG_401640 [Trichomonas vaginalis G3]KAI5546089.1 peptidyl-prolyl cis-trans isomerase protein [Trichomonas vaginalis G3]|eukprot:XP_001285829.1 hypothetical protein [Trichomonas vaginalis G3]